MRKYISCVYVTMYVCIYVCMYGTMATYIIYRHTYVLIYVVDVNKSFT